MRAGSVRFLVVAAGAAVACVTTVAVIRGQSPPDARPPMAEDVFRNVQVLRGIPVNEFMGTMGIFSAALGMSCEDCHRSGDSSWENYAAESPRKQMARSMVVMMRAINATHFGGRQAVTCYSCHRGSDRPKLTPNLTMLYGAPPLEDPRDIIEQAKTAPSADEVFRKYLDAVGGTRATAITSWIAMGTSAGYGPDGVRRPIEIVARAPNQRTSIVRAPDGDRVTTFDGRSGWISAPHRPVSVLALSGADLDGLRLDAELMFPSRISQLLGTWRVGRPTSIEGRDVHAVQGSRAGGATATLFFDVESGLLVRQVRYVESPVGRIPTQVDYADYRDVSGVKMPFRITVTWLDGRDMIELSEMRANVPVDAGRFLKPLSPVVARPAK
jgi:hypothetical protein